MNQITAGTYDKDSDIIKKYAYYYEFNEKHLLTLKQVPGKEPTLMYYDDKNRLRVVEDGNMRADEKILIINYDLLGRVKTTGISAKGRFSTDFDEEITITRDGYYTGHNFYDNYDFVTQSNLSFDAQHAYHQKSDRTRGKSTGSKTNVVFGDGTTQWLASVVYYDRKGRVIQAVSENHLGGYDKISFEYNFAGELLKKRHTHTDGTSTKELVYLHEYDDMGRLLDTKLSQSADESGALSINKLEYNELGQIAQKKIHSEDANNYLQTVDYEYNIKGALTKMNDPHNLGNDLFGMELHYDKYDTELGNNTFEDGKISAMEWSNAESPIVKSYRFNYDEANRLISADYSPLGKYSTTYAYDKNGNISNLTRMGQKIESGSEIFDEIDNLHYTYNGNQLTRVDDEIGDFESQLSNDFRQTTILTGNHYSYDANGNLIQDWNKGIQNIEYNHLNQPTEIQKEDNKKTKHLYTAGGQKLRTELYVDGNRQKKTDYAGPFVYENGSLQFINIPGGRIKAAGNVFQYNLTDHLGNVRVTFQDNGSGTAEIIQTDNYYPFGLRQSGEHYENTALLNKYLYNGKELQDQNEFYDYGFRQMDPALGRWFVVDPWAEKYYSESPYVYAGNNPVSFVDFLGLGYTYDFAGDYYVDDDGKEVDWDVVYASFSGNDIGYYISGSGAQDLFTYMQNSYMNFTLVQAFGNSYIVASAGSLGNMQFSGNGGITFSNDQNAMPAVFSGETPPDANSKFDFSRFELYSSTDLSLSLGAQIFGSKGKGAGMHAHELAGLHFGTHQENQLFYSGKENTHKQKHYISTPFISWIQDRDTPTNHYYDDERTEIINTFDVDIKAFQLKFVFDGNFNYKHMIIGKGFSVGIAGLLGLDVSFFTGIQINQ